jgi:hypothetical protein
VYNLGREGRDNFPICPFLPLKINISLHNAIYFVQILNSFMLFTIMILNYFRNIYALVSFVNAFITSFPSKHGKEGTWEGRAIYHFFPLCIIIQT